MRCRARDDSEEEDHENGNVKGGPHWEVETIFRFALGLGIGLGLYEVCVAPWLLEIQQSPKRSTPYSYLSPGCMSKSALPPQPTLREAERVGAAAEG